MCVSGTRVPSQRHIQLFSQQPAPYSGKNSLRKTGAGSMRQVFWL